MKVIFFGNPKIAIPILESLLNSKHQVLAVITNPDKPTGRGKKIMPTDVKKYALEKNLKVLSPQSLKDPEFISSLKNLQADIFIVFSFGKLPKEVWSIPKYKTINLHASYLPNYRGAAPINWAIINGESETGVSTFFINDKIDTGEIILRKKIPISFTDTATTLTEKIINEGKEILLETLDLIESGNYKTIPQNQLSSQDLKKAPKLSKQDCKIDWNKSALQIYNFIRGLSEKPTAWTYIEKNGDRRILKIYFAEYQPNIIQEVENPTFVRTKKDLFIALKDGTLKIKDLQLQDKKRMSATSFIQGFKIQEYKLV